MSDEAVHPLVAALAETVRLLEAGEPEEAAAVLQSATDLLATPPDPTSAREAQRLIEHCRAAETSMRHQVIERLRQLGATKKAQVYQTR